MPRIATVATRTGAIAKAESEIGRLRIARIARIGCLAALAYLPTNKKSAQSALSVAKKLPNSRTNSLSMRDHTRMDHSCRRNGLPTRAPAATRQLPSAKNFRSVALRSCCPLFKFNWVAGLSTPWLNLPVGHALELSIAQRYRRG